MTHAQFGHSFGHADIKYSGHFSGAKQIKFMHIYMHKAVKGLVYICHLLLGKQCSVSGLDLS